MRFKAFYLILLAVLVCSSCQEDGIVFPTTQNTEVSFLVTIDGVLFSTENASFTTDNVSIFISATIPETKEIITLKVDDFEIGSFSFEGENNVASSSKNNAVSSDVWSTMNATSSRGNIEFTSINFAINTVSGSFNFLR
ncbi:MULTISPECIES: hypothetical protein [unclassified Polaribacter]|uniref:hypothetical protein n=1 Tax=unclassified Polaribacter TaxID=196858 RepID=UPI0011BF341C|nr:MULTISPECIES: hypothetical protein [unclassified Polaribacter]TXD50848.1 hypothetical protein ES043_14600 [Polaribacter sp. IC063]TXD57593.1 hypothetical protein ES044_14485 [Polaribacter sp. IC066]